MKMGNGSTFQAITTEDVKNLMVPFPHLPEQRRIDTQLAAVEKAKKEVEEQLIHINALPAAILRQAFSGEL
jgi:type I restriction enzyme S subunit